MKDISLTLSPDRLAVCRLTPDSPVPLEVLAGDFWSLTRTPAELSVVTAEHLVPQGWQAQSGWRCLHVQGPLQFDIVGVISSLSSVLAEALIPIFVISTYDTDIILVQESCLEKAAAALQAAGYPIPGLPAFPGRAE